jgi:UDP-glucose 4-epimerase
MSADPRPRALITGAAGFIGSHVADDCLALGMEVVATDDLSGGYVENVPEAATWVEGDLRDAAFVKSLWDDHGPYDFVYHLGAYAAEGLSHFIRAYNYRTNLEASVNLVNQAVLHDAKRFVFTSSIAVYGAGQVPMTEDQTPLPEDPYGISKYAVELDLKSAHDMFGLEYTVFRPHNVYGDGTQTRAFSHIADVAPIIARSPLVDGARNEVFNIGADTPYSILDLVEAISRAFDAPADVVHNPARNEVVHAFSDHAKVRAVFDPPEPLTLDEGIQRMAAWVREHGARDPVEFAETIEIERNLPPSWRIKSA